MPKGEGTLGSLVQMLVDDLHVPIPDVIRRKAVQAMRFHKDKRYWFSDRLLTFTLTSGRQQYKPGDGFGLPADLVEIVSKTIWIKVTGSEDQRWPCNRVDTENFQWSVAAWGVSRSQPQEWCYNLGALRFSPVSQSSTDVCELRYVTDLGVPKVVYENGAYVYYHPTTGQLLTSTQIDAWTNDWLTQDAGHAAIYARTMYDLQKTYLRDLEGANETLANWLEMITQLENETESKTSDVTELVGTFM